MTVEIKINRAKVKEKIKNGQYDVFLCYNYKDEEEVMLISKWLEDNGIAPWCAKWGLRPGFPIQPAIEQVIENIGSAAIFIGKEKIDRTQRQQIDTLLSEFSRREIPVIPLLLESAPCTIEIPRFLDNMHRVDFRKEDPDPLKCLIKGINGNKPEKVYRPGVLIASLGDSPVIVSSMYKLLTQQEKLTIDRVVVLCPDDKEVQCAYKLVQEALPNSKEFQLCYQQLNFKDADSWQNACIFLQRLYDLLKFYQEQDESVYLSLAGGRKSMAALIGWIVPFFPCIRKLYHIIDKEEENFLSAYEIDTRSSSRRLQLMLPDLAKHQLSLVEIPIVQRQQISEKLRSRILSSRPEDFKVVEALITAQTILLRDSVTQINVTKNVRECFINLCDHDHLKAQIVLNGLLKMSRIKTLRDSEIGTEMYTYHQNAKAKKRKDAKMLHYFTCLEMPIRPVFYTLPIDSDDQIERVVICSLEEVKENGGYRTLEEVATSPDFSVEDWFSIDKLPPVLSPADSVLIVPLGKSPMVATQLYTLLKERERRTIHEVVLIYPQGSTEILNGAELVEKALGEIYGVHCELVGIEELEDITNKDDCWKYQEHLKEEIERVKLKYPNCEIDLALSGGRKGMTAMTIFAAQKMHIPYVYHTLITDEELSEQIEEETTVEALNDTHLSQQEAYDRLFLRAPDYREGEPHPYGHFVLFRVPVFSADGW